MLLHPASSTPSAAKIGVFGPQGSGKSLTSALIAIGLSKTYHQHAPVAILDPEDASDFLARVFESEGVPLVQAKARSFVEMREALAEAESVGCCAYLVDNYTAVHGELVEAVKAKANLQGRQLPYPLREELYRLWAEWVREMRQSPLHIILGGRLGWVWGDDEDENGDTTKVRLGSKMRGESDAGYEPNLLLEMESIDASTRDKKSRSKRGSNQHWVHVLKDRMMILNGLHFSFRDLNDYQAGDYEGVFKALRPHFDKLTINRTPRVFSTRTSADLFQPPQGESSFAERSRRITVAMEELKASLEVLWPGGTDHAKACRMAAVEALFGTRSLSAVESKAPDVVESALLTLKAVESHLHDEDFPTNRAAVIGFVLAIQTERRAEMVL
jgi:hypothetical protein